MGWARCFVGRVDRCTQERDAGHDRCTAERDAGYNQCTEERDFGYNRCTQSRDDGYRDCCTWWPCSWGCKAWVWVSNIVCVAWTWVSNIVCVAWTWVSNIICVAWTWVSNIICVAWVTLTTLICLIPGIGEYLTSFLDGVLNFLLKAFGHLLSFWLKLFASAFGGVIDFLAHPIESIETFVSLLRGCPSARASHVEPLQVIAHHGAPLELPENTLQSCERALKLGANSLEVDICMTSDLKLILWHDWDPDDLVALARQIELAQSDNAFKPDVPPVGDAWRRPTIELTLDEMRAHFTYQDERDAVAKIKWKIDHGDVDLNIPTLDEFLRAASGWQELRIVYLDIKMPRLAAGRYGGIMADKIHEALSSVHELRFKLIIMVPDSLVLQAMKDRSQERNYGLLFTWDVEFPPGVILNPQKYSAIDHATTSLFHNPAASVGRPVASLFPWRMYRRTIGYDIDRWNRVNTDPARFNAGVRIDTLVAWTINDKDEMRCLARMGVSGIITDKIGDLASVAAETGR